MKVKLPVPTDTPEFFEAFKKRSNSYWGYVPPDGPYGYEFKKGTKWRPGLTDAALKEFEHAMGFAFPTPLRNFYKTMNGLDTRGTWEDEEGKVHYHGGFYSFPDDLQIIRETIQWIYDANGVTEEKLVADGISRIFPIYAHRFLLIDEPLHPVLSMYGNDVIYWADSLSKTILYATLGVGESKGFRSNYDTQVKFWVENK
ncbi:SMI1/KNR4 family protein [Chitinophaga agrisoli]|uniref:SMI1/KNR4 family protein n=1 Tax=Chitinophaga agrisoli TaxID=2607653 RepID=A0A5B2VKQ7_9BACT|nr:SMI1/KNR4 family protein [Chitinophaga agrisoli]KAA2238837.1 SMI1/KNR4 family protein [Chitinophaga agrisoli]